MNAVPETIRASAKDAERASATSGEPDALHIVTNLLVREHGTKRAGRLLRELGLNAAARYLDDTERRRVCRQMLDAKKLVRDVCERLMEMGMRERTAYRLIDRVLCQRGAELAERAAKICP